MMKSLNTSAARDAVVFAFMLLLSSTPAAHSDTLAVTFSYSGVAFNGTANLTFGWEFTLNEDIQVTELGVFDANGDGMAAPHDIGLWSISNEVLLVTTSFLAGTVHPLDGDYRYIPIAPLNLTSGVTYAIAVQGFLPSNDAFPNSPTEITPAPQLSFGGRRLAIGANPALIFPNITGGSPENMAVNFKFAAEEPPGEVLVTSFNQGGLLVWTNTKAGVTCHVEWASSRTGTWHRSWGSLRDIAITNETAEALVPIFYRVVCTDE